MSPRSLESALLHEFKNHLSVIKSFSDFLLMELPEGDVRKDVMEIQKASTAALNLVPQLLPRDDPE